MPSLHTAALCDHTWSFRCIGRAICQLSTLARDCPFPHLILSRLFAAHSFPSGLIPSYPASAKTEERRHAASRALTLTAALGRLGVPARAERRLTIHVLGSLEEP